MEIVRPAFALHPKHFGKGRARILAGGEGVPFKLSADIKLFATTFLAGFLFVSILIG